MLEVLPALFICSFLLSSEVFGSVAQGGSLSSRPAEVTLARIPGHEVVDFSEKMQLPFPPGVT